MSMAAGISLGEKWHRGEEDFASRETLGVDLGALIASREIEA